MTHKLIIATITHMEMIIVLDTMKILHARNYINHSYLPKMHDSNDYYTCMHDLLKQILYNTYII